MFIPVALESPTYFTTSRGGNEQWLCIRLKRVISAERATLNGACKFGLSTFSYHQTYLISHPQNAGKTMAYQ